MQQWEYQRSYLVGWIESSMVRAGGLPTRLERSRLDERSAIDVGAGCSLGCFPRGLPFQFDFSLTYRPSAGSIGLNLAFPCRSAQGSFRRNGVSSRDPNPAAEEKQTIVNLVAADLGVAIVPRWTSRISSRGVCYVPLEASGEYRLPLAVARTRGSRDATRDEILKSG
jgi:DNA-binding transcriptional LysR family regulator